MKNEPYSVFTPRRHERNMARLESIVTVALILALVFGVAYLCNPFRISADNAVANFARAHGLAE